MGMELMERNERPDAVGTFNPTGAREVAEVQAAMVIAKKFPRDTVAAMERIKNSCQREGLARVSTYQYSRGGTEISGPSIRLAECIAQQYGNIQYGIRELEQVNGESIVESFAWDIETNTRATKTFKVPHVRHTKKGSYRLEDSRDIYEMVANQGARRLRACLLSVIPGDVVEDALRQCEDTLKARVKITPELLKSIAAKFAELGVSKTQIEGKIQRRLDAITPAQVVNLGNILNSINDGMSKPEDWFDAESKPAAPAATQDGKATAPDFPAPAAPKAKSLKDALPPKAKPSTTPGGFERTPAPAPLPPSQNPALDRELNDEEPVGPQDELKF